METTQLYRKKPVVIEAMLFTMESKQFVYNWSREQQMNIEPSFDDNKNPVLIIPTLEGDMVCSLGDYLIKEPFPTDWRKFYPCKPEIFLKTYEPLPKEDLVVKIDYNNIPQGEVLLLTTSKVWIIGDWYKGEWRTHRSQWVEENGINRLKSAFTKEEITHYSKLPSWENL